MPELTQGQLTTLDGSRRKSDRIAAAIARRLADKAEGTPVGSDVVLADELDVSASTVCSAKHRLRTLGVITKSGDRYYVH